MILQHIAHLVRDDPQLRNDLLHMLEDAGLVEVVLLLHLVTEGEAEPPEVLRLLQQTQLYRVLQLLH